MLNALRHQRNWNPPRWHRVPNSVMCSTPYGIKGIGTNEQYRKPDCVSEVLNALRHQRNWNPGLQGTSGRTVVLVLNALRHQRNWNTLYLSFANLPQRVLNALRHQRNWNQSNYPTFRRRQKCAQRLTASKELERAFRSICRFLP